MPRKIDPNNPTRLAVLAAYRANPNAPLRELAEEVGVSLVTVCHHLDNLEAEGLVTRIRNDKQNRLSNSDLQKRIDMVVEKAKRRESKTQHDVIRHVNAPLRMHGAQKLG